MVGLFLKSSAADLSDMERGCSFWSDTFINALMNAIHVHQEFGRMQKGFCISKTSVNKKVNCVLLKNKLYMKIILK